MLSDALATYRQVHDSYAARGVSTERDPADKEVYEATASSLDHYLDVGREALELVIAQLVAHQRRPPTAILDLPSGSGRVTRHFRAAFPDARIGACDLYPGHIEFCASAFGAEPILSRENFDEVAVAPEWDVVFVGSLLTHLPRREARQALRLIQRSLSPTGIALVTLEGRRSVEIQRRYYELIGADRFTRILAGYRTIGHGFAEYTSDVRKRFSRQARYGAAFIRPGWITREIFKLPDVRLLGYEERAWDNHQDVVVFGRPGPTNLGH